jgi:hypothetical protein
MLRVLGKKLLKEEECTDLSDTEKIIAEYQFDSADKAEGWFGGVYIPDGFLQVENEAYRGE